MVVPLLVGEAAWGEGGEGGRGGGLSRRRSTGKCRSVMGVGVGGGEGVSDTRDNGHKRGGGVKSPEIWLASRKIMIFSLELTSYQSPTVFTQMRSTKGSTLNSSPHKPGPELEGS